MSIVTEQDLKDIDDAIKVDKIHAPIHEKLRDVYFDLAKAYREHEDMTDMILADTIFIYLKQRGIVLKNFGDLVNNFGGQND